VGRISKDKNLDFLLDIYSTIAERKGNVNLILAGDGPYLDELKEKASKMKGVYFTDTISQELLPDIYSGADLFVMPSITDTFGMVVLEAQACGLPALVSDVGGPKEIIVEGETGFVAKANDAEDWINKIERIISMKENDSNGYESLRNKARDYILQKYDWNSVIKEYQTARSVL
jgi:glycosyltransferase involved in cell wall biosynthesis